MLPVLGCGISSRLCSALVLLVWVGVGLEVKAPFHVLCSLYTPLPTLLRSWEGFHSSSTSCAGQNEGMKSPSC